MLANNTKRLFNVTLQSYFKLWMHGYQYSSREHEHTSFSERYH